ncbi:hypothetical protein C922_05787 [Plasmodium inui San Antonio 1]|uniref:Plasmodium RESA N-terminal domain-containing protein n=1 Tax=Plasmodium inui San Antonio 1 TaxID=1237626 RepID=W6ZX08_9APIC|nr:hypothetical protein C922_05787 [Plasmodium inui San Antonio 1]EUD63833.1 hypothetical protein C922_05787 [Plasmodium inui San Antonio 1]
MALIQERNLSELNENGCLRKENSNRNVGSSHSTWREDVLSGPDRMDLGGNKKNKSLDGDKIVEGEYEEEDDLRNIYSPSFNGHEMIFTRDVTEENVDASMSNIGQMASRNDIIRMWKETYSFRQEVINEMIDALFKYYQELKERHKIRGAVAITHWNAVLSKCFDILTRKEDKYKEFFISFIITDDLTKEELVKFFDHCKLKFVGLRQSLETLARKQLYRRMIPKRGGN